MKDGSSQRIMMTCRRLAIALAVLMAPVQPAGAKAVGSLAADKIVQMAGGDERDIIAFVPNTGSGISAFGGLLSSFAKPAAPSTAPGSDTMSLIVTPQSEQPRVVILYDIKQAEIERQIMGRDKIVFTISGKSDYNFIRVTPVGSRYHPATPSNFTRSAPNPGAPVLTLEPYTVELRTGPATPAAARPDTVAQVKPAQDATPIAVKPTPAGQRPPARPVVIAAAEKPGAPKREASPAAQGARIALVVGNGTYGAQFGNLANPVADTRLIARSLKAAGFQVEIVNNVDQKAMKRAVIRFGQRLMLAGKNSTGLFYYAGHGVQSNGTNYLVPVNARIESEADVDIEAVPADAVVRQMEQAGASTSIVILDACRNLPMARSTRSASRGLARMEAPNGSYIAYSTAPGAVAQDGSGGNSPFARALAVEMARPGVAIETVFRNVRRSVLQETAGKQVPWDSSSLLDSFVFVN
ncbi:MAG: hypothetical protein RL490_2047 [Pseudomonadota bacterium]|jgi:hypothetical protein